MVTQLVTVFVHATITMLQVRYWQKHYLVRFWSLLRETNIVGRKWHANRSLESHTLLTRSFTRTT